MLIGFIHPVYTSSLLAIQINIPIDWLTTDSVLKRLDAHPQHLSIL